MTFVVFGQCVVEGNEAAGWLAKEGTDLDGGTMATINAAAVRQEGMYVYAARQHFGTFSLPGRTRA